MHRIAGKMIDAPWPLAFGALQESVPEEMLGRLSGEAMAAVVGVGIVLWAGVLAWKAWLEHQDRKSGDAPGPFTANQTKALEDVARMRAEIAKMTTLLAGRVGDGQRERFLWVYDRVAEMHARQEAMEEEIKRIREAREE